MIHCHWFIGPRNKHQMCFFFGPKKVLYLIYFEKDEKKTNDNFDQLFVINPCLIMNSIGMILGIV